MTPPDQPTFLAMLAHVENTTHIDDDTGQHSALCLDFYDSPIGQICCIADDTHLYLLEFIDRLHIEAECKDLYRRLQRRIRPGRNAITEQTRQELADYFAGKRDPFSVPAKLIGTPFQCAVWQALTAIPYGATWSYAEQARYLKRDKAVRAVARTNALNRIAIIYPCHRVIGSNGSLTGYAGGLERKAWLLEHERA